MTYEEFFEIVCATYSKLENGHHYNYNKKGKVVLEPYRHWPNGNEHAYVVEWVTGGASGGNCWGDEARCYSSYDIESEPEIDFTALFEKICPNMTFLQYRKVMRDIVKCTNRTDREYYGNYTENAVKTVKYRDLFNKLVEVKAITND